MPSLWGSFSGKSARQAADEAYQKASTAIQGGYAEGSGLVNQYYGQARDDLNPYAERGNRASSILSRYLGLDGADAQRQQLAEYAGADPFRRFNEDNTTRAIARQFNGRGMLDSGNFRLAAARANLERGSQDYNSFLDRLTQTGNQGFGAANQLAQMAGQTGATIGGMRMNLGTQQAGNAIQYGNAKAAADGMLWNNILKVGSLGVGALGAMNPMGKTSPVATGYGSNFMGGNNYFTPQQAQSLNGYF